MIINNIINFNILFNSPLDQFGADNINNDILSLLKNSILSYFDILDLDDSFDISLLQTILSNIANNYFYDDDDCADSE
jgi:hypothetical protein